MRLAVVGLADLETIRAQGADLDHQLAVELMLDRDPPWLVEWAELIGRDAGGHALAGAARPAAAA